MDGHDGCVVTGATVRTAASGARIEQNSTDGLKTYDAGGNPLLQLPVSGTPAGHLVLNVSDTSPGKIVFNGLADIYSYSAASKWLAIIPNTGANDALFSLGRSSSTGRWANITAHIAETFIVNRGGTEILKHDGTNLTVDGNIVSTSSAYYLGSSANSWNRVHADNLYLGTTQLVALTVSEVNCTVRLRPYQIKLDRSIGGWTNATEVLDGSNTLRGYIGEGAANLYGISLGESSADRGALQLKSRSTSTQKPGTLILYSADGTPHYITVSNDGKLRINTSDPNGNDTTGTIVGTQTA